MNQVRPAPLDAAARYDWECRYVLGRRRQDVPFWMEQARRRGGPVLELACGTGRILVALAESGIDITGVDLDPAMVAAARRNCDPGDPNHISPGLLVADMRRFAFARRFGLIFVGYNSLQLLVDRADVMACLDCARTHLAARGAVGVEVTDFQAGGADGSVEDMPLATRGGISLSGSLTHCLATRTSHYRRHYQGPGWTMDDEVVVRSYDEAEITAVMGEAGLRVAQTWRLGTTTRVVANDRP